MALATATITYNLADLVGLPHYKGTSVTATTNIDGDTVVDTAGNLIRIGSGKGTIAADGSGSIVVWIPGTGSNPASWQTYIHVRYRDPLARGGNDTRTFGPFTITVNADLADLVQQAEVPPAILGGDAYMATIDADGTSQFRVQQDARLPGTIAAALPGVESFVRRAPGVRYLPIAGVIRKTAGLWAPIDDAAHTPTNIASVDVIDDIRIRVNYGVMGSRVVTLGAWLDESYAYYGYHIGASVNPDYADFYVYQTRNVAGYVAYDGTTWTSSPANEFRNITFSAGVISMEHDSVGGANLQVTPRANSVGTGREYFGGSVTATTLQIEARSTSTNTAITAPDASIKLYVDRGVTRRAVKISEMAEGSTNLWVSGLMEA